MKTPTRKSVNKEGLVLTPRIDGVAVPRLAYSMQETAQVMGISYISVHRLLKRGLLKSSSALRHKLIPHAEIERFLKSTLE